MHALRAWLARRRVKPSLRDGMAAVEAGHGDRARDIAIALERSGAHDQAAFLRAQAAAARGDQATRRAQLELACRLAPGEPAYAVELAYAFADTDELARAIACLRAVVTNPESPLANDADLHHLLARWCHAIGNPAGALAALSRAVELKPDFVAGAMGVADMLGHTPAEAARARDLLRRTAQAAGSESLLLRAALRLPLVHASVEEIEAARARLSADLSELEALPEIRLTRPEIEIGSTAFRLAFHGRDDRDLLVRLGQVIRRGLPAARDSGIAWSGDDGRARPRIAFVSACLWAHSVGRALLPILEAIDRDAVEVLLFSVAGQPEDDMTARLAKRAERRITLPESLEAAAAMVAAARADLLVYPEIGMHPFVYLLAQWRLAPRQCVLAGHPETTGLESLDHFVSDGDAEPGNADDHYSERLLRVTGGYLPVADLPGGPPPDVETSAGRYLCSQTVMKLHPDFDALLAAILARDPRAEIALFGDSDRAASDIVAARLQGSLGARVGQVRLLERTHYRRYLDTVAGSAVMLDTPHFGGGNTTLEALRMHVPVVTLAGTHLRGRFAATRLRRLGLDQCVAGDAQSYAETAVALARSRDLRRNVTERLAALAPALLDNRPAAAALARALVCLAERNDDDGR